MLFFASTLNLASGEFLSADEMNFFGTSTAEIINQSSIDCSNHIYFVGQRIENDGDLKAENVALCGGTEVFFKREGDSFFIKISGEDTVHHTGRIEAVQSEIRAAGGQHDLLAINHEGVIHAQGFEEREGRVILKGEQAGVVKISGKIQATSGNQGGTVHLLGEYVQLLDEAKIDVSGNSKGGTVLIGGDYKGQNPEIRTANQVYVGEHVSNSADALIGGNGGKVIFWSNDMNWFFGNLSACGGPENGDGGFVEISSMGFLLPEGLSIQALPKEPQERFSLIPLM